ncbi:Similar to BMS1: Ribosome biogenesis protein BMS1 homolog (Homo sapiens) [Cotesia congregata]|uniref:Similar to BMS1: Ribosome biogenesis protein BMS1 homolog (Homo sapiens) n=1 Tax=Cotesia congregata TaxID=51543 RepID=A0A8J2HL74_COTCN|nr:Similar to BMS1: Ribosome biogenesis protein BMS1 homolog (Homo sapiens) [Cotesia congregata]
MSELVDVTHKSHREHKTGRKAEKKKLQKEKKSNNASERPQNPKAFTFNSAIGAERRFRRKQDLTTKKTHIPYVDRTPIEPPPILVAVVGPPKVGKSLLIHCLIKNFTRDPPKDIKGPVTVVSGKKQRITFVECNNDLNSMIDIAKVADLVLLLADASFGFEMEIFEFLNICQVHGMPKIMGVLTHLDLIKDATKLKKTKKVLKHRFWTEVYNGAKLFYLSGQIHNEYLRNEVKNLARFISVMKFRQLTWRSSHPYILADRVEDMTDPETVKRTPKVDRTVCFYGYMRGCPLRKDSSVHIPGVGDLRVKDVSFLPDPCPLPETLKKRALIEKERLVYAPFSGAGGIIYDKDAVYVELGGSHSFKEQDNEMISGMIGTAGTLDEKLEMSELKLFSDSKTILSKEVDEVFGKQQENVFDNGRMRRKVIFNDDDHDNGDGQESGDNDEDDENDENDDEEEGEESSRVLERIDEGDEEAENVNDDRELDEKSKESNKKLKISDDESSDLELKNSSTNKENAQANSPNKGVKKNATSELSKKISETLKSLEKKNLGEQNEESDDEMSDNDSEGSVEDMDADGDRRWWTRTAEEASREFENRRRNVRSIMKLVYDVEQPKSAEKEDEEEGDEVAGIFRVITEKQKKKIEGRELEDQEDTVFYNLEPPSEEETAKRSQDARAFLIQGWQESEDANELLKLDNLKEDGEEEEVFGDFEDLETGEKFDAKTDNPAPKERTEDEDEERKKLLEKKRKIKQQFDALYDDAETQNFYEALKRDVEKQAELNKTEFDGLDDYVRVQVEGFRPGMYVRVEVGSVPCELLDNFDPTYPLILGGLLRGEENIGLVQTKFKKHRWYPKILKTRDPVVLSVGWRRFQTIMIYAKLEDNMRQRMLKYTPKHLTCMGHFWGPITPQGTGVLAVQDVNSRNKGFRIIATGSVAELDKNTRIVKKLKLIGEPKKIYKKTAFIGGMFNSKLEVAKFEGAKIKTVSGIRGLIKRAEKTPGWFRATFEDKIQLSDIVFCRTWVRIEVPHYYNPVINLLLPHGKKNEWRGMRTVAELKKANNIKAKPEDFKDSLYTPIERQQKVFQPLRIPKALQKALPYRDKPKLQPLEVNHRPQYSERRVAVVRSKEEESRSDLIKRIRALYSYKEKKAKAEMSKRMAERKKLLDAEEMKRLQKGKQLKKQIFSTLSKMDAKNKNSR